MFIGVGVSCSVVSYLYVKFSGLITLLGEERELRFLLSLTCNDVVSVRRGFLFLLVLRIGYVILLLHSLCLSYNHLL